MSKKRENMHKKPGNTPDKSQNTRKKPGNTSEKSQDMPEKPENTPEKQPKKSRIFWHIALSALAAIAFCISLFLLRYQLVSEHQLPSIGAAIQKQINYGLLSDAALIVLCFGLAFLLDGLLKIPAKLAYLLLIWFTFLASFSNLLYFKFFGNRLDFALVKDHIADVPDILDCVPSLANNGNTIWALVLMVIGTALAIISRRWFSPRKFLNKPALIVAASCIFPAILGLCLTHTSDQDELLSANIVITWLTESTVQQQTQLPEAKISAPLQIASYKNLITDKDLAEWRDSATEWPMEPLAAGQAQSNNDWPLLIDITNNADFTAKMRQNLGLKADQKPNIIMLFVESFRAYELLHPEMAPVIFPHLSQIFAKNGLVFDVAYSSARVSGQTARGQFSTQCSFMPNNNGKATYLAYPKAKVRCLQEILKNNGYKTIWTSGGAGKFHGMANFEQRHGTEAIYDTKYFESKGVKKLKGGWGLADFEFLSENVNLLNELAQNSDRPIYANISTLSTHHPYSVIEGHELPEDFKGKFVKTDEEYGQLLSRWHYEDAAIANFLDKLFNSEMGENTLVILVGDHTHSVGLLGIPNLRQERIYRIGLALVTKHMQKPGHIKWPVHQIDIAPTVAHIVGAEGKVGWLGRGLFARPGSPWIYSFHGEKMQFRIAHRLCYLVTIYHISTCYTLKEEDPLFAQDMPREEIGPKDMRTMRYILDFYRANEEVLAGNKIIP